jgi:hypothetical protein
MQGAPPAPGGVNTTEIAPRGRFGAGGRYGNRAGGYANGAGPPPVGAAPGGASGGPPPPAWGRAPAAPTLALSEDDVRDLFLIVELAQRAAPGRFVKEDARGEPSLEVSFAHSAAFETRFRDAVPDARGRVLVFTVLAHQPDAFHPNFTFVQDHETFTPAHDDPRQLGFLEGGAGELPAEGVALGYVVLSERMDPSRSLDLYWNDRRIETRLQP